MTDTVPGQRRLSKDTQVQHLLREAILHGDFGPRQRLVEADLCAEYDAGRFAVRAALQALEAEGLVERQRNRGARIREVRIDEAIEISQIRMVVEGLVASLAASRATTQQIRQLKTIGRDMRAAVRAGEAATYSELNAGLHQALRDIAAHEPANRIIAQLRGQMVRHQFNLSRVPGRAPISLAQHEDIITAVSARDPDRAEAAMRSHIASVIDALTSLGER